jgi:hypothetical protein
MAEYGRIASQTVGVLAETGWRGLAQVHNGIITYFGVEKGSQVPNIVILFCSPCTCRSLLNDSPSVLNLSARLGPTNLSPLPLLFFFPAFFYRRPVPPLPFVSFSFPPSPLHLNASLSHAV